METIRGIARRTGKLFRVCLVCGLLAAGAVHACTIFVLTDGMKTLFFNNEDFSNLVTRIWIEPAGSNYFGATYVGFDDGWAQGGVNSEGLAFDWVASGGEKPYTMDPSLKSARGNPSQRMLESCRTVEEAIDFYKRTREPEFNRASILIADKSGASVIVSAREGKIHFDRSNQSRGFGYGNTQLQAALRDKPGVSAQAGLRILGACKQEGLHSTKYSTVYNLGSGEMTITTPSGGGTILRLSEELAKGAHYYDIPSLSTQHGAPPQKLLANMIRFPVDQYQPVEPKQPHLRERVEQLFKDVAGGSPNRAHYSDEVWERVEGRLANIQEDLKGFGRLLSVKEVRRAGDAEAANAAAYLLRFENVALVQHYSFTADSRVAAMETRAFEKL